MTAPVAVGGATTFRHRPSLDGLRGIAVAAVLGYHFAPDALPGGFVGVDVFFVLSGFLLSSLLVREARETGRVGLGRFFVRRVRRLLPATLMVLLAVAAYAAFWAPDAELDRIRRHSFGALSYTINWVFVADGTTYTDLVLGASPLRHMWSLAIEEQFYVVLALAVAALAWTMRSSGELLGRRLGSSALGLATLSAVWMVGLEVTGADRSRLYFGSDTRLQAMLLGVALGSFWGDSLLDERRPRRIGPAAAIAGVAGLVTLVGVALVASEESSAMYRGGFTVVAVAAALLVVGTLASPAAGTVMSFAPLVALGTVSYGVYLWHWPVLVVLDEDRLGLDGGALTAAQLAITFVVSIVSYALVEQPVRRGELGERFGRRALLLAPLAVVAVGLGTVVVTSTSTPASGPADDAAGDVAGDVTFQDVVDPALSDPSLFQIVVVGDSVMHTLIGGELGDGLRGVPWTQDQTSFDPSQVAVTTVARPACSFVPARIAFEVQGAAYEVADLSAPCGDWRADLERAVGRPVPATVTVVMPTNDLEDHSVDGEIVAFGSPGWDALLLGWIDEVTSIATDGGSAVVLVAPAPRIDPNWSTPQGEREAHVAELFASYAAVRPDVDSIDLGTFVGDDPAVRDDGLHYTRDGARSVAAWLLPQLEAARQP